MTTGNEPQIGGQSTKGNEPELSNARPKCEICGAALTLVEAVLYVDGKYRFENAVWSYVCACNKGLIRTELSSEDTEMIGEGPHRISVSYLVARDYGQDGLP